MTKPNNEEVQDSFSTYFLLYFCLLCSLLAHLGMNSNTYAKVLDFWYTFYDDNDALFLSLFLTKLLNCFANAGFASKDSKIFGGDHK